MIARRFLLVAHHRRGLLEFDGGSAPLRHCSYCRGVPHRRCLARPAYVLRSWSVYQSALTGCQVEAWRTYQYCAVHARVVARRFGIRFHGVPSD
jgi:hypothetical protein